MKKFALAADSSGRWLLLKLVQAFFSYYCQDNPTTGISAP